MTTEDQERKEFAGALGEFERKLRAQVPGLSQLEVAMAFAFAFWKLAKDI